MRRLGLVTAGVLVAVGLSLVEASPASAAGYGYVRLAHLSPDTPDVDVYLSSVTGAIKEQVFPGVGYGVVSAYERLPTGTYAVAMRLAHASPSTDPVLSTEVTVAAGKAYTVAGVGMHAELGLKVLDDDFTLPSAGKSKIRIIQASIKSPVLDVSLAGGSVIAQGVPFATTTDYRLVEPGTWTVQVEPSGGGTEATLAAHVTAGNVYSLLVLDGQSGLTAELRPDAGRSGGLPFAGVATGAGGTAPLPAMPVVVGGGLILLIAAVLVGYRFRRAYPRRT
jgi:uncharacterized protein DUF4397